MQAPAHPTFREAFLYWLLHHTWCGIVAGVLGLWGAMRALLLRS